ncbi:hypothetical protein F4774DRAFT_406989 [Daldinia eschscholtzii]|nr:hypothetical protein F4774DRAFT_406989 [Daldinia eschscholtzii]
MSPNSAVRTIFSLAPTTSIDAAVCEEKDNPVGGNGFRIRFETCIHLRQRVHLPVMADDAFRYSGTAATNYLLPSVGHTQSPLAARKARPSSDPVNGSVEDHWRFCTQRKYVLCDYLQGLLGSQRYYDPYPGPGGHVESHF